jgi:hypothetical protein
MGCDLRIVQSLMTKFETHGPNSSTADRSRRNTTEMGFK